MPGAALTGAPRGDRSRLLSREISAGSCRDHRDPRQHRQNPHVLRAQTIIQAARSRRRYGGIVVAPLTGRHPVLSLTPSVPLPSFIRGVAVNSEFTPCVKQLTCAAEKLVRGYQTASRSVGTMSDPNDAQVCDF